MSTVLNPSALEWKPTFHPAQPPPPPPAAVPVAAFFTPPFYTHTFYLQNFIPLPHLLPSPEINTVPPPLSGGEDRITGFPATAKKARSPPRGRRPNTERVRTTPRQRQEWRPKNALAGGYTASPPQDPASGSRRLTSRTTVMIKNVPNQLRREGMLKFLDDCSKELSLEYNFLYLPMDFGSGDNLGYAFVNFTSAKAALEFKRSLQNYRWGVIETAKGSYATKKICEVSWAAIQGKERLMKKFENSTFYCDNHHFLPVELDPPRNGSNAHLAPPRTVGNLRRRT